MAAWVASFGTRAAGRWSIAADHFITESSNFFDHNPLGESDIFLPIIDQGTLIEGSELTVRSPALWPYGQLHLAYSNQTADCFGSITGWLVVAGTACGGYIELDHDQRNTLNLGYNANLPRQFFLGALGAFDLELHRHVAAGRVRVGADLLVGLLRQLG